MEKSREVIGNVIKEESISLINHHKLPDTLVINIDHPFPGLHGMDFHLESKPRSVIIATSEVYSFAKILREAAKINNSTSFDINASFAKIKAGRDIIYGIRIKGLDSYSQIPELQKIWEDHGFKLLRKKNLKTEKPVSIKISKFFHIEEIEENIYKDACIDGMYFIEIPEYLPWEEFRKITMKVKNNISNNNFDAVKGLFYKDNTVKDMIRIFKPNIKEDLLQEIKKRYYKEMI
jgi:hypothetical protein